VARAAAAEGTLVIMGLQTHLCVLATALDAARRDLRPVVVADACAARERSLHRDALRVLSSGHAHVATADEVISALAAGGSVA
jgi:isochorismate hydrolase